MSAPAAAVYVYELPVRLWHAVNALAIVVLALTGYLIAEPLASPAGEASEHFLMGYIRFAHFAAGYILAVGFLGRIYWAYAGNEHARQIFLPPLLQAHFWDGVWQEVLWYAFLTKSPRHYIGHNPLAILAMHFVLVWGSLFMIFTGFALYGEGEGQGSWQYTLFSSWLLPLFGDSQTVHTWHHLVMWLIVCFVLIHVYVAVREDKLSGQSMLVTIVTGWRTFKDDKPVDDAH
ncbi:Ni/Fe-hydrogenase, b-type cytochrome subunit [Methylomonas koyamae]|uniref:Ni/Fe-hydrogenase, b-type cytochrome subunit n=1 Tax=Methylomonas koyamae TaxID=702114 RepID=A0A177NN48_9GAMM|nr:Ni/Fe-hydrogenase, b-type cytochrome subunit [Methylomonas koyamae]OAI19536.1 Ni/Fe-hydrogenase, b-type cytochrome subunit [Methylomonas koyamae]